MHSAGIYFKTKSTAHRRAETMTLSNIPESVFDSVSVCLQLGSVPLGLSSAPGLKEAVATFLL